MDLHTLDRRLRELIPGKDRAIVTLVVLRLLEGRRLTPERVRLDPQLGVIGDRWALGATPNPEAQVTLMRADVARLMSEEPAAFGDNLFAALDTSAANLPAGTLVRVGTAVCQVTAKPHTGCAKFSARAGADALAISRAPEWKVHQLRGVHLRVLEAGEVAVGDEIVVVERPPS